MISKGPCKREFSIDERDWRLVPRWKQWRSDILLDPTFVQIGIELLNNLRFEPGVPFGNMGMMVGI